MINEKRPRHYANDLLKKTRALWDKELPNIPEEYRNTVEDYAANAMAFSVNKKPRLKER